MKNLLFFLVLLCRISNLWAQGPWKIKLHCPEEDISLHIDLYEESIKVPGMEMFGPQMVTLVETFMGSGLLLVLKFRTIRRQHLN